MTNKTKDRVLVIPDELIHCEDGRYGSLVYLQAIMLYPEDEEKITSHYHALLRSILESSTICTREEFIKNESKLISELLSEYSNDKKNLMEVVQSRKSKGFTKAAKGALSGQVLYHLVHPAGGVLEQAYSNIINSFKNPVPELVSICKERGTPLPTPPSKSTLKSVWNEFKNVSHLWAADFVTTLHTKQPIFSVEPIPNEKRLTSFLRIASFFRVELIYKDKTSTNTPLITNPMNVWDIRGDDQKQFPPQAIFT